MTNDHQAKLSQRGIDGLEKLQKKEIEQYLTESTNIARQGWSMKVRLQK